MVDSFGETKGVKKAVVYLKSYSLFSPLKGRPTKQMSTKTYVDSLTSHAHRDEAAAVNTRQKRLHSR